MTIAFFWTLLAVAVGVLASNKGRSGIGWFLLSVLISPLLGLIFCAVASNLKTQALTPSESTHLRCPACAEWVLPAAIVCKHCGHALTPDPGYAARVKEADMHTKAVFAIIIIVAVLAAIVGYTLLG